MDEFALIDKYFGGRTRMRPDVCVGIGDDAAVVDVPRGHQLVMAVDALVGGVHFDEAAAPRAIGHKALAVNLSDLAAMGATPGWATLLLVLPSVSEVWLGAFSDGFFALAERHGVALVGGDTARGPLTVGVQLSGWVPANRGLRRSGAGVNDDIYVSGTVGDAGVALRQRAGALSLTAAQIEAVHRRLDFPCPRTQLGQCLLGVATAAIDLSDGLAADLGHLLAASGVGGRVYLDRLPRSEVYRSHQIKLGWDTALASGDDYELCFTAPPQKRPRIEQLARELGVPIARVGVITAGGALHLLDEQRSPYALNHAGYKHFSS